MYIVNLNYIKEVSEVEKYLEEHIKFLEKYYEMGKFICSGRKNPRTGGVILLNAESLSEVEKIIAVDGINFKSCNISKFCFKYTGYYTNC